MARFCAWVALAICVSLPVTSLGQTWTPTAPGTFEWFTAANWSGGIPNSPSAAVNLNNSITGNQTITLNQHATINQLFLGAPGNPNSFTLQSAPGTSSSLGQFGDGFLFLFGTNGQSLNTPLFINGNLSASNNAAGTSTFGGPIALNGTTTFSGNGTSNFTGPLNGAGTFTVSAGTVNFSGSTISPFTGTLNVNGGTVGLTNGQAFRNATVAVNAGTLNLGPLPSVHLAALNGTGTINTGTGTRIVVGATGISSNANNPSIFNGTVTGGGGITKVGTGFAALYSTTTNTNTGPTVVRGGFFYAGQNATSGAVTNVLNPATPLVLLDGTFQAHRLVGGTFTQNVSGLTLGQAGTHGSTSLSTFGANGGTATLNLGAITRTVGTTVGFGQAGPGGVFTTTNNTNGILGGWAIYGSTWAAVGVVSGQPDQIFVVGTLPSFTATSPATDNGQVAGGVTVDLAASQTINTLRASGGSGPAQININGANTQLTIAAGGVMTSPAFNNNFIFGTSGTAGTLTGPANGDLILHSTTNSTTGIIDIQVPIVNNPGGPIALTTNGPSSGGLAGFIRLRAANTYTGGTFLNGGTLQFDTNTPFSTGPVGITGDAALSPQSGNRTLANSLTLSGDMSVAMIQSGTGTPNRSLTLTGTFTNGVADNTISLRSSTGGNTLTFASTGSLRLAEDNTTARNLTFFLGGTASNNYGLVLDAPIVNNAAGNTIPSTLGLNFANANTNTIFARLSGNNTYSGGTLIRTSNPTALVELGSDTAFGTGTVTTVATVAGSTVRLNALGAARTLANRFDLGSELGLNGTNSLTLSGTVANTTAGDLTLRNVATAGASFHLAGSVLIGSPLTTNAQTLTLAGTGAFTISGGVNNGSSVANHLTIGTTTTAPTVTVTTGGQFAHTGMTTVANGTLLVNTILNQGSGALIVSSGTVAGTLGGTGTINRNVTLNSGTVAGRITGGTIGTVGTLTIGGTLTGQTGSRVRVDFTGAGSSALFGSGASGGTLDRVNVTGLFDLTSPAIELAGTGTGFNNTQEYSWIIGTGQSVNLTGLPSITRLGDFVPLPGGAAFSLSVAGNQLLLNYTPVPEPGSTLTVAALGLAGLWRWRGARRR